MHMFVYVHIERLIYVIHTCLFKEGYEWVWRKKTDLSREKRI